MPSATGCEFDSRSCAAGLILGWVTVCGREKPFQHVTSYLLAKFYLITVKNKVLLCAELSSASLQRYEM